MSREVSLALLEALWLVRMLTRHVEDMMECEVSHHLIDMKSKVSSLKERDE